MRLHDRARRPVSKRRQIVGLLVLTMGLGLALLATVFLTQTFGAELGDPCTPGLLACKNQGFNDARCLTQEKGAVCTRLCETSSECPTGLSCGYAVWTHGGDDDGRGRVERVCLKSAPGDPGLP